MASTLTPEQIEQFRKAAKAAEPYSPDDPILDMFDDRDSFINIQDRILATQAREILQKHGIPLDEIEDARHD